MLVGVIKTRDILRHPISVLSIQGVRGFFRLILRSFGRTPHCFLDFLEITATTFVGRHAK